MKYCIESVETANIQTELPELLAALPEWRRRKALKFRYELDRYLCARSFQMLQMLIEQEFGIFPIPQFSYTATGKPFFSEYPALHFSISHCKNGIACAVNDSPVGIDIEAFAMPNELLDTVFTSGEIAAIESASAPEQRFAELWTQKESILKLTGEGICDDMKTILSSHNPSTVLKTIIFQNYHFAVSIAVGR